MSINMVVLEYSHCGSFAYCLYAEIEFNGCKRLHMTCKTKIFTIWPLKENNFPSSIPPKLLVFAKHGKPIALANDKVNYEM